MKEKYQKEIDAQLEYEDLRDLLSDNFTDTLDFLRDYADSFVLFYDFEKNEKPDIDVLFNEYPYKDLKSDLISVKLNCEYHCARMEFKFNNNTSEWLKKQGYSNIYVPCLTHPINRRKLTVLILYKNNDEIIHLDDGVFEISNHFDNRKFKNKLAKYLRKHCLFYKFAKSVENKMKKLDCLETVREFANSDYPDLYFMQQFSDVSNRHLPELYSEEVVEFCSRVMIERHKNTNDEFLFGDLFIWLECSWEISVGWGKTINNPAVAGWQNIRDYIVTQDKSLICKTLCKILRYVPNKNDVSIYNCASIFKEIGSPFEYINDKHVEDMLRFFEQFQLESNFYLDEHAKDLFESESYKAIRQKYNK